MPANPTTHDRSVRIASCVIAAGVAAALAACYSRASYPDGVIVEAVKYEKAVFFRGSAMNLVSDLRQGDFDGDGADDILAVGADGAHILAPDGREKRYIGFRAPESPWAVRLVGRAADGKLRLLGNLPKARQTVLFDETGAVAWTAPGSSFGEPRLRGSRRRRARRRSSARPKGASGSEARMAHWSGSSPRQVRRCSSTPQIWTATAAPRS